jgi:hypothetical protein
LHIAWPEDASVPVTGLLFFLFYAVRQLPNLRAIARKVVGKDEFGQGLAGGNIYLGVKASRQVGEAFKQGLSNVFDISRFYASQSVSQMRAANDKMAMHLGEILVKPGKIMLRGRRGPADRAENYTQPKAAEFDWSRDPGLGFDRIFERTDQDGALYDRYDDPASGKIGDRFFGLDLGPILRYGSREAYQESHGQHDGWTYDSDCPVFDAEPGEKVHWVQISTHPLSLVGIGMHTASVSSKMWENFNFIRG